MEFLVGRLEEEQALDTEDIIYLIENINPDLVDPDFLNVDDILTQDWIEIYAKDPDHVNKILIDEYDINLEEEHKEQNELDELYHDIDISNIFQMIKEKKKIK